MTEGWERRLRDLHVDTPPDMWRRVQEGPRNVPSIGLAPRRQRVAAAAVALAVFAAAAAFAWQAFRPAATPLGASSPTPPPGMSVYTDPLGWSAFYPSGWSVTTPQHTSDGLGAGVTIQNSAYMKTSTVPDGVALTITHPLDATPDPSAGSSSFPLAASDFKVSPGTSDASVSEFMIEGVRYQATLRVGSAAPRADVTAMGEVIASIRPPSSVAAGLDSASVCPAASHANSDYVEVGGVEVRTDVLQQAGVPWDQITLVPQSLLQTFFTGTEAQLSQAPQTGWRPIVQEPDHVEIAAPMSDGKIWYYVSFTKKGSEWSWAGSGANEPIATAAQRGAGLRLAWRGTVAYDRRSVDEVIWLVNDRDTTWNDDRGEYWAIVHLFDPATGQEILMGPAAIGGVGRTYSVLPGAHVQLPLAFGNLTSVPDGQYDAVACVPELALASPVGTVAIVSGAAAPS
jgi:hypothetical protein